MTRISSTICLRHPMENLTVSPCLYVTFCTSNLVDEVECICMHPFVLGESHKLRWFNYDIMARDKYGWNSSTSDLLGLDSTVLMQRFNYETFINSRNRVMWTDAVSHPGCCYKSELVVRNVQLDQWFFRFEVRPRFSASRGVVSVAIAGMSSYAQARLFQINGFGNNPYP